MVCSPHQNQLAGIGYLATINAYRDMPIAAPQFQTSYSQATTPIFGYRNQSPSSDLSGKVQAYKQFQDDSKAYEVQRIYIREYITTRTSPFGYMPNPQETTGKGGQSENQPTGPNKSLDSILQNLPKPNQKQATSHTTQSTHTNQNSNYSYRSEIEYNPRATTQSTHHAQIPRPITSQNQTTPLRDRIKESLQQLIHQNVAEMENKKPTNQQQSVNQLKPMRGLLYV